MNSRNLALMGVAVACGLVAAFLTASLNTGSAATKKVKMWVARKDIKQGDLLTKKDINEYVAQTEVEAVPEGIVNDLERIIDNRVNRSRRAGEPFYESDLTKKEGLRLPEGTYALALKVSAESMAGGFVLPGSKIDLYMSETVKGKVKSSILMRDVLVVAVDIDSGRREDRNAYAAPSTVTLAVTTKQALELQLASERGKLRLTLRDDAQKDEEIKEKTITQLSIDDKQDEAGPVPQVTTAEPKKIDVVFAAKKLDAGTEITEDKLKDYFTTKQLPEDVVPEGAFASLDDLRKRLGEKHKLSRDLFTQFPVIEDMLRDVDAPAPVVEVKVTPKDNTRYSVTVIQNGALNAPQSFQYRNGVLHLRDGNDAIRDRQQQERDAQSEKK